MTWRHARWQKCAMSPNPEVVYKNPLARSCFLPHRDHGSGAKLQSLNLASSVSRQKFVRSLFIARSNPYSVFECDKSEYEAVCPISRRSSEFRVYVKTIRAFITSQASSRNFFWEWMKSRLSLSGHEPGICDRKEKNLKYIELGTQYSGGMRGC